MPLDALSAHVQSPSVNKEINEDTDDGLGPGHHDDLHDTAITRKSTDKKTSKLSSSLLVRGRDACPTEKKEPPSQTTKTRAQDSDRKHSRSSIFVLLGSSD